MDVLPLSGIHHTKIPVSDLARSLEWYCSRLGYTEGFRFIEGETWMGVTMEHPNGGPPLGLRLAPAVSAAVGGFDFFAIGVPDRVTIEALAARLSALGERHAGVHRATLGWILPMLHDPDGHEVRFYTVEHHTSVPAGSDVHDPRERADALGRPEAGA